MQESNKVLCLGAGGDSEHRIGHGAAHRTVHSEVGKLNGVDLLLDLVALFLKHPSLDVPVVEGALIKVDEVSASLFQRVHPQSIVRSRSGYGCGLQGLLAPAERSDSEGDLSVSVQSLKLPLVRDDSVLV